MSAPSVELVDAQLSDGVCSRRNWSGEKICNAPATVYMVGACVHEHLAPRRGFCDACAVMARAGVLACISCRTGAEPHYCFVSAFHEESA